MAFLLKHDLQSLYDSLSSEPLLEQVQERVKTVLEETKGKTPEGHRKTYWEVSLRKDVLDLAVCRFVKYLFPKL